MANFPRIYDRAEMDGDDDSDAIWLAEFPSAVAFGYDDGVIRCAFGSASEAAEWLVAMVVDSMRQRGLDGRAADYADAYMAHA